ncbi:MAG: hypothetical protein KDN22_15610 [Verrucomicrobiae bacterium]|nr:hypothetical protein [Verrucomicrobiae bacterium]
MFQSLKASRESGPSVSGEGGDRPVLGERTMRLLGVLGDRDVDLEAYKRHLENKHIG